MKCGRNLSLVNNFVADVWYAKREQRCIAAVV